MQSADEELFPYSSDDISMICDTLNDLHFRRGVCCTTFSSKRGVQWTTPAGHWYKPPRRYKHDLVSLLRTSGIPVEHERQRFTWNLYPRLEHDFENGSTILTLRHAHRKGRRMILEAKNGHRCHGTTSMTCTMHWNQVQLIQCARPVSFIYAISKLRRD